MVVALRAMPVSRKQGGFVVKLNRVVGLLFLVVASVGLLAACGGDDPTATPAPTATTAAAATPDAAALRAEEFAGIVTAAKGEGQVVVFGPPGDSVRNALTEGFQAAYPGVKVEWSGGRGGGQGKIIKEERGAGLYTVDVVIQGLPSYQRVFKPLNVTQEIMPGLYDPTILDLSKWRNGALQLTEDGMDLGFTYSTNPEAIYDPKQVSDPSEIDTRLELLDPKWKGKIIMNDPIPSGAGYSMIRNATKAFGSIEAAEEWLSGMKEQAAVSRDQRGMIESVIKGEYAILVAPSGGTMGQLARDGVEFSFVNFAESKPDYSNSFGTFMRLNKPPNPNAQIVFMNWFLSQEGQTAWSTSMNLGVLRLDVANDHLPAYSKPRTDVEYGFEWKPVRTEQEEKIVNDIFGP